MKIILCFVFIALAGCNLEIDSLIETYGYEKKSDCNKENCLFNAAKIILYVSPEHQSVTYKLIQNSQELKNVVSITSYDSLKNCKVVSNKDFNCDDLESDDGVISGSNFRVDMSTNSIIKKEGTFSKYEAISGSKMVYYVSKLARLSKENIELIDNYGAYILFFLFLSLLGLKK
ncbi:hypothetical protein [Methylomonas rivi]|uniref:Lipoprotein n=1 Tax=Methylomonas rivi TaxID=2952226 RepID=A0ABT1U8H6_9GAMM|nr:hypothetical protein [Methylomonas sp. WSC-6]MCQ8130154.1 hypothetical protein [Methylomonas sp. WSC-6]